MNLFEPIEVRRGVYAISTDNQKLDVDALHAALSQAYWARGRPRVVQERALAHSLNFGLYHQNRLVGFARVVSDFATFAYLADVYVDAGHQGQGLGKWLVQTVLDHPELQNLRRWLLATQDAHGLYAQFGFKPLDHPERFMHRFQPYPPPEQNT